jgi:hypothetical protein
MDNIFVAGTKHTPEVKLERGIIKFAGRSVPSDPEFFDPNTSNKIQVSWFYEEGDDDMFDLGKILKSLVPSDFKFIEIPEQT